MTDTRIVFTDTETTGLNPSYHDVWEVAVVHQRSSSAEDTKVLYQILPNNLRLASEEALQISGFYERFKVPEGHQAARIDPDTGSVHPMRFADVQRRLIRQFKGAVMVANNVTFDAMFLRRLIQTEPWHYRPIDIIAMAATHLGLLTPGDLPWRSEEVSRKLGVEPPAKGGRHTAMGDALWVRDMWDALVRLKPE